MVDREHMQSLIEARKLKYRYRGRSAHAKHTNKLKAHADHLKRLESSGDLAGYCTYLASKVLVDAKAAKAARAIAGISAYTGQTGKLKNVQELLKNTLLHQVKEAWEQDFHSWFAFKDMLGLKGHNL